MAFSLSQIFSKVGEATDEHISTTVGIDIGGSSVKVVEIEETPKTIMLRTYGELQLGPYDNKPLGEVVSLPLQQRTEALTDVMRESGVSTRHGALAMSLTSSFLTVISITGNKKEDLAPRIPVEARKYVPLPLKDVTLDWAELPSIEGDAATTREVLLAAIENNALNDYRMLLGNVGMTGEPAEIEAFSLIRGLWRQNDSTLAIVDVGARSAKLYIVRAGMLERLHRIGQGGREITDVLSKKLQVPFEEAENIKRTASRQDKHGQASYEAMTGVTGRALDEFKRILDQYEARLGSPMGRVLLTGGVSTSPGLAAFAQDKLGRAVEYANPFAKVAYPAFMEDTVKAIGPVFAPALGAALRRFQ